MLVSIGVARPSKNVSFIFLNKKMAELIGNLKLMETFEVTKHSAVRNKSRNIFLYIGTKKIISMSKPGAVVLPKRIYLLESLASYFKNTIFKITSDTLEKGQKKPIVATILNTSIRLSSAYNIENYGNTITSSRTSTSMNEDITLSSSLVLM